VSAKPIVYPPAERGCVLEWIKLMIVGGDHTPSWWCYDGKDHDVLSVLRPDYFAGARKQWRRGDLVDVRCGHRDPLEQTYLRIVVESVALAAPVTVRPLGKPTKPAIVTSPTEAAAA